MGRVQGRLPGRGDTWESQAEGELSGVIAPLSPSCTFLVFALHCSPSTLPVMDVSRLQPQEIELGGPLEI